MSHKNKILIIVCLAGVGLFVAIPTFASWPATPLLPKCARETGDCGFNDFILLGVNLTKLILSIVGSLALLMFVYGGIMFLLAGGKSDLIDKGKKIITNAVIGVALVLGAWIIVNFAIAALTGTKLGQVKIFGTQDWWVTPGAEKTTNTNSNANANTNTTPSPTP